MAEEKKINEAETESVKTPGEDSAESEKKKISSEIIIILLIGLLFGIAIKTEFSKRINVVDSTFYGKHGYSFDEMQKRQDALNQAQNPDQGQAPEPAQPE
jgi:hypothetical protein